METLNHLTPKKVQVVANRIGDVRSSIKGLGSLFIFQGRDACYDQDEMAGVGHLLQSFANHLCQLEDILRCGYDSVTKAEIERDYEDEPYDDDEEDEPTELPNSRPKTPFEEILVALTSAVEGMNEKIDQIKSERGNPNDQG